MFDFHFWKEDPYTGKWWNKHGSESIEPLGVCYPGNNNKGWIFMKKGQVQTLNGYELNERRKNIYYNSITFYFAYKGKFWSY